MRVLITGASGQLGTDCAEVLRLRHSVMALGSRELDITAPEAVSKTLKQHNPEVILNCAAFTKVDACETQKEKAWLVNVEGPRILSQAAKDLGALLVHVSSDYVFDGARPVPEPYTEEDDTGPVSYYGLTKWQGEEAVRQSGARHCILRTAWLYGIHGPNFLKTILTLALKNRKTPLRVVNDQWGCPTWSHRLALQIDCVLGAGVEGTLHATAEGHTSWYGLASFFLGAMGIPHWILPCPTEEYPTPAKRPRNSILENRRLKETSLNLMEPWEKDVTRFVRRFRNRLLAEAEAS